MNAVLQGFIFGLAYVAPIGTQNIFVINSATNKDIKYIFTVTSIVIFFDISLALACFIGIGIVFDIIPMLRLCLLALGFFVITYMGIKLVKKNDHLNYNNHTEKLKLPKIIFSAFSVAWLNPQALIDGTIIFGSMRSSLLDGDKNLFIAGVCLSSFLWFNIIAIIVFKIADKFKLIAKFINIICGIILIIYGIKLGYVLVTTIITNYYH